ncbi:MAG: hypothetical protein CVV27_11425 [Candidatus Melainabacteria bacterium HGW-Melainabacteria-1]|nr:MAG: hypothetical protein CVV27_11425 [Candidatus Melainabacteria bacterium HGW-Melainabacteria-1]
MLRTIPFVLASLTLLWACAPAPVTPGRVSAQRNQVSAQGQVSGQRVVAGTSGSEAPEEFENPEQQAALDAMIDARSEVDASADNNPEVGRSAWDGSCGAYTGGDEQAGC